MSSEPSPGSAFFLCLLNYFPSSRDAAMPGARLELLIADRVQTDAGGCAVSQLGPWVHRANVNFRSILGPCSWWFPLFLGIFMSPKGEQMSITIHPLALQPSQSGSGLLQPPHSFWQGGSRAVPPSTNPIKRSTVLSCSSKL